MTNTPVNGDCVAALTLDSKIRRMMIDLAATAAVLFLIWINLHLFGKQSFVFCLFEIEMVNI